MSKRVSEAPVARFDELLDYDRVEEFAQLAAERIAAGHHGMGQLSSELDRKWLIIYNTFGPMFFGSMFARGVGDCYDLGVVQMGYHENPSPLRVRILRAATLKEVEEMIGEPVEFRPYVYEVISD